MKHIVDHIIAAPKAAVQKPAPKFKIVKPSPVLNGGSATTDVIR
ncbi:MAG TPA: hypothetical protein VIN59_04715 [Alphaproteobacteria bacterium]